MPPKIRPILMYPTNVGKNVTIFLHPAKDVEISIPKQVTDTLLETCNGFNSEKAIIEALSVHLPVSESKRLLRVLQKHDVLIDASNITPLLRQFVSNPTAWAPNPSQQEIDQLVAQGSVIEKGQILLSTSKLVTPPMNNHLSMALGSRKSVRSFIAGPIEKRALWSILWSTYGFIDAITMMGLPKSRTVPSGGALYPLEIYLGLPNGTSQADCSVNADDIAPGCYRVTYGPERAVAVTPTPGRIDALPRAFLAQESPKTAGAILALCVRTERSTAKYGNRGIIYSVLEAGHAAQNAHLAASTVGYGSVEIGGFIETRLSSALGIDKEAWPVITILVGKEAQGCLLERKSSLRVRYAKQTTGTYTLPFHMAFASIAEIPMPDDWGCGRSPVRKLARVKAIAESVEWSSSSRVPNDVVTSSFHSLQGAAINPEHMIRYLRRQFKHTPELSPFDPDHPYEWIPVREEMTGMQRYVLADFVIFPYTPPSGRRYAFGNSSGGAAHTNAAMAVHNAVLEIIERDAFMLSWLHRRSPRRIAPQTLPHEIQTRIERLQREGFRVTVTDISREFTFVALLSAVARDHSFFTCAAAADFQPPKALEKALMELEASLFCQMRDGPSGRILAMHEVDGPADHGLLYQRKEMVKQALFLLGNARRQTTWETICCRDQPSDWKSLMVTLTRMGFTLLTRHVGIERGHHIIRAFIPGLIPMTFGYAREPLNMQRIRETLQGRNARTQRWPPGCILPPHPFN